MSDLIERLHLHSNHNRIGEWPYNLIAKAADALEAKDAEIERLQADLQHCRMVAAEREEGLIRYKKATSEIERLRAEREHYRDKYFLGIDEIERLRAENEQHIDIRSDMETMLHLIAEGLGVGDEPHQTWNERVLQGIAKLQAVVDYVRTIDHLQANEYLHELIAALNTGGEGNESTD